MSAKDVFNKINKAKEDTKNYKKLANLGLYLTPHALMGYHGYTHNVILGSRGRGKSVISLDAPIAAKKKYGYENVKIFYFRVSDLSVKTMMANHAAKAIDPILVNKYDLDITTKTNIVYDHGKPLIEFYALTSAGKVGKGVNLYDATFLNDRPIGKNGKPIKRFIYLIIDEFLLAEGVEKKTVGNPVDQWKIYLESILRDQERLDYDAVKIFYLANAVSECAPFLGELFNFIPYPGDFGIKKLTRQHCLIWNVPNSQAYLDKRKNSYTSDVLDYDDDPNYTNVVKRDLETIKPKQTRITRVTNIIAFGKLPSQWFCVYDGRYIKKYHGETVLKELYIPMYRNLDMLFTQDRAKAVLEQYELRGYRYVNIMSQASFVAQMKIFKNK